MFDPIDNPVNMHFRAFGQPGTTHESSDDYIDAIVSFVDITSNTFEAVGIANHQVLRGVQFAEVMPNHSGEVEYPVGGDTVRIRIGRSGVPYMAEKYRPSDIRDENTGMPKHKFVGHPYLRKSMPGDKHYFGFGGGFLSFLRGGITKIGSSPLCQLIFIKFENMIKLVSQQWHFMSSGIHAYSLNDNGNITTRISIYRKDCLGANHESNFSQMSDYDILIDDNGIQFLAGPVDGIRKNRTLLRVHPTGAIFLAQGEIDQKTYRQTFTFDPCGSYIHEQFDKAMKVCTYHKEVTQCDDFTKVSESLVGSHIINMTGKFSVNADEGYYVNGAHIRQQADISILDQSTYHATIADVKND